MLTHIQCSYLVAKEVQEAATVFDMQSQSILCCVQSFAGINFHFGERFHVEYLYLQLEQARFPLRVQNSSASQKQHAEICLQPLFSEPSELCDDKSDKACAKLPDVKLKNNEQALWRANSSTPAWVKPQLRALRSGITQKDVYVWNKQIKEHIKHGENAKALELFQEMEMQGLKVQSYTYASVLKACTNLRALAEGRHIHEQICDEGCKFDIVVCNSLIDMYGKCGSLEDAWNVFKDMPERDIISWNAMLFAYVRFGDGENALIFYQKMQQERVEPDCFTFVGVLKACSIIGALEQGKHTHCQIIRKRLESNVFVGSSLVSMYAKCGDLENAFEVFNQMPARDVVIWNTMIRGCIRCKQFEKAFELFQHMRLELTDPDFVSYVTILEACASTKALEEARYVHAQLVQGQFIHRIGVKRSLIDVYAKCGCIEDASGLFNTMPICSVVLWNAMIMGYAKSGESMKALELFQQMHQENIEPDAVTFLSVLSGCASLAKAEECRRIHAHVIQCGHKTDTTIANCLIDAYVKCSSIDDACKVFNNIIVKNSQSWNAMIAGYLTCDQGHKAQILFRQMQLEQVVPSSGTFASVLNATFTTLEEARKVHAQVIQCRLDADPIVASCLIKIYARYVSIEDACNIFNQFPSVVGTWTAMIAGYVKCGLGVKALELFEKMQLEHVQPNSYTFVAVLNACASLRLLKEGQQIHKEIVSNNLDSDITIGTTLIDMYVKCGSINDACRVFNNMPVRNVVSWNALMTGYVTCGLGNQALALFQQFLKEHLQPDSVTFVSLLNACASLQTFEDGRYIHKLVNQSKLDSDVFVQCSLINMYATCGSIEEASRVFNNMQVLDLVSLSAMIGGYVKCGQGEKALSLYNQMMQQECFKPDSAIFVSVLNACASIEDIDEGRQLHAQVLQCGLESDVFVGTSLVDMYAKCGEMQDACRVFQNMPKRNVVSWNALITGYVKARQGKKALYAYHQMQHEHVVPDSVTFVGVLNACASATALAEGRIMHQEVVRNGLISDIVLKTCLVNMYSKCGSIEEATKAFTMLPSQSVVCYNAMIFGYALNGLGKKAVFLFEQMCREDVDIDSKTLSCLLSGLSHTGQVGEGLSYFESMVPVYGVQPAVEHYSCIIDLLGRAGHLEDAENVMKNMWCQPDVSAWMALLGACKIHCNVELGEFSAEQVFKLEPEYTAAYVLLSNLYASAGKWDGSEGVQQVKKESQKDTQPKITSENPCVVAW